MRAGSTDPLLSALLRAHPGVGEGVVPDLHDGIAFGRSRRRDVAASDAIGGEAWFGLIELADNNPLVCADRARTPSPGETLASIALGPLVRTGLLAEPPTFVADVPLTVAEAVAVLRTEGALDDVSLLELEPTHPTVRHARATALISGEAADLEVAFAEPYDRVLFVRRDQESAWNADLVARRPWALYRLGVAEVGPPTLVTVSVMADLDGKLGACQMIHLMNVMDGQEESLGIPDLLPPR